MLFLVLAAGLLTATGCGGSLVPVAGTVTINGQPAGDLQVSFDPNDPATGTTGMGFTKPDGSYELHYPGNRKGAPAGEYTVRISVVEFDNPEDARPELPVRYNEQSELQATVESGKSQYDFPLTVP